ncbi:MAG: anthranilate phosphoribosyltransferase [Bacillus sp. (in: firmicutes)]
MQQYIKEVAKGKRGAKDLSYEQTKEVAKLMIEGNATEAQMAAYFIAQRIKMESSDELLAFVHAFQESTKNLTSDRQKTIDFAGPYTGRDTFAATIPCAILLAEKGVPTFLHSSDSLPPRYGSSIKDILEELQIDVDATVDTVSETVDECKIGFAWTEKYCEPLGKLRAIRKEIGVRTMMNTVEKLVNISNAKSLMMGAFHRTAIVKIAPIFANLSYENVYIVQGVEGSEDLPVHRNSFIYKITNDQFDSFIVKPEDYDLYEEKKEKEKLTTHEQAQIIVSLLNGENSEALRYYYKQVLFNMGIRYYLFGVTESIEEGIEVAKEQLNAKRGLTVLNKWRQ